MGVDGFIFERRSKRYFSYDRDYQLFVLQFEDVPEADASRSDNIRYELGERDAKVSSADVVFMAETCAAGYERGPQDQRYHALNCRAIAQFAKMLPDGEFFIRMDNDDAFDLIGDMHGERGHWKGEYSEWKPVEWT